MKRETQSGHEAFGLLLVAGSAIAWSTAGYFTRLINLDVWTILFWRGIFGGLAILAYMIVRSPTTVWSDFRTMRWQGWLVAVLSATGMIAFVGALKLTTVANVSLIYAASPFVTAIFAWLLMREAASRVTLVAATFAMLGIAIMFQDMFSEGNFLGIALSLVMTTAVSATTVVIRKSPHIPMTAAVCLAAFVGSALSAPAASPFSVTGSDLVHLAIFGASQMGLGLILYVAGCRIAPAAAAAVVSSLETPLAPFWVWWAFGELPTLNTLIGGTLILVAVLGQIFFEQRAANNPDTSNARVNEGV